MSDPDSGRRVLMMVDASDEVAPVEFTDAAGHPASVHIADLQSVNGEHVAMAFDHPSGRSTWLVRVADSAILDLDSYLVRSMQIQDGTLYAIDNDNQLSRIDMADLVAQPVNNPAAVPVVPEYNMNQFAASFLVVSGEDRLGKTNDFVIGNDGIVAAYDSEGHIFLHYTDGSVPWDSWNGEFQNVSGGTSAGIVYGEDGYIYQVKFENTGSKVLRQEFSASGWETTSTELDSNTHPDCPIRTWNPYRLEDRNRYILCSTGFYTMAPVPDAGITLTFTPRAADWGDDRPLIAGDFVYWSNETSIQRLELDASSTPETVVTASNVLGFKVVSGQVIFVQQPDATTVQTFLVPFPGAEPQFLCDDSCGVNNVIDLAP